jgi:hypothetical protein
MTGLVSPFRVACLLLVLAQAFLPSSLKSKAVSGDAPGTYLEVA